MANHGEKVTEATPPTTISTRECDAAIAAADRATVLRHRALGIPLLVWRDGRMVEVDPRAIDLPDDGFGESVITPRIERAGRSGLG